VLSPASRFTADDVWAARHELARRHLLDFASLIVPDYIAAPHHTLICERLEAVERGDIDRLMIAMPPRHGKSQLASRSVPGMVPWPQPANADHRRELQQRPGQRLRA
jgi:hypothetical protein